MGNLKIDPPLRQSFCTVFDKNYLVQGLALFSSLQAHETNLNFYALCLDDVAYKILNELKLEGLTAVMIDELMTPELISARDRMTYAQFCWTSQPLICEYVLNQDIEMVTYVEADSMFFSSAGPLFEELGLGSISLSPHNYQKKYDKSPTSGIYCTQFNTFRRDVMGLQALIAWKRLCLSYSKLSPDQYPGQKGLDTWPLEFEGVVVLRHPGAGVAPWNINKYEFTLDQKLKYVDGFPMIFYHFHAYGRCLDDGHYLGGYPIPKKVIDSVYREYILALRKELKKIHQVDPEFNFRRNYQMEMIRLRDLLMMPSLSQFRNYIRQLRQRIRGRLNIYSDSYFY